MTEGSIDELIESVRSSRLNQVNAGHWSSQWSDKWVAFVDLIGMADRSKLSAATAVHQIVRFHRALSATVDRYPDIHVLRFTDAAYATADSGETLIKFSSDLQHMCLALNALQLQSSQRYFDRMIVARTTIAYGSVLEARTRLPTEDPFRGVHSPSLMIGSGIVDAYRLERQTAGGLMSVEATQAGALKNATTIRGINRPPRRLVERWIHDPQVLSHDGVTDVPWLMLRSQQPSEPGLWATNYDDALAKLQLEVAIWRLSFIEYTTRRTAIDTIKHFGAMHRHLNELFQGLKDHVKLKAWDLGQLETAIATERSRLGM